MHSPLQSPLQPVMRSPLEFRRRGGGFNPARMFTPTTPGWVYDLSDFSTLFQDSVGTIPVTAVEQPVGLVLDKSGNGNHASQPTTTKRPVLSSRVNLLTYSEQLSNAAYTDGAIIAENSRSGGALTIGTTDSYAYIRYGMVNPIGFVRLSAELTSTVTVANVGYKLDGGGYARGLVDLVAGVPKRISGLWNSTSDVGRVEFGIDNRQSINPGATAAIGFTVTFDNVQFEYGPTAQPYQRITTATDYDTEGFPLYLKGDGVDDFLSTAAINFTGTDAVTTWTGVQKLSDANPGVIFELGTNSATVNGTFGLLAPHTAASSTFAFNSRGTAYAQAIATGYASPYNGVITAVADISTPTLSIAVNSDSAFTSATSQGTGNYSSNPVYFMSRAGTSNFFGGKMYSQILLGRAATAAEDAKSKKWVADRCGVTL